ncbi:response regulator [Paenibacillus sp. HB172176]|uniref:response regulator transcription factor n=1 Tax=Paenibacillus sp. HB172176 TaxID=2493690 RepID=UPI00143C2CDB|nr:response regulator [Paenibacillus sp. HB172176]
MYNLLIVDDEKHYTDSLAETVSWAQFGIKKVFKAYSASQALELLDQDIDILLTDIRMPKTSGLELIEESKRRKPDIECLLLTGYAEFDFARKAVELQAIGYLLKPVKDEQLFEAMHRVVRQIEAGREARRMHAVYRENVVQLKSKLLAECLRGVSIGGNWTEKLMDYGIDIQSGGHVALCLIGLGDAASRDLFSHSLMQFATANILEELLRERYDVWWTAEEEDGHLVAAAYEASGAPPDLEWLAQRLGRLKEEARRWLKVEVTAAVAEPCLFPHEMSRGYAQGKLHLQERPSVGKIEQRNRANAAALLYEPPMLTHLLESEQWEEAKEKVRALMALLYAEKTGLAISDLFFHLSNAFLYFAHQYGKSISQLLNTEQSSYFRGKPILHVAQLESWAIGVVKRLEDNYADQGQESSECIIAQTRHYIQSHLGQDLSLAQLADHVYVHPNHLSKVFKQTMHLSLSQYIYQQRIQKAAELLKATDAKIYQVGERVGYPNTNWFIKKFKEYYRLTPQEYRERGLRGGK